MNETILYKIHNAYVLPYNAVINKEVMHFYDTNNEIIASSRIYMICRLKKRGFFRKRFTRPEVLYIGNTFNKSTRFEGHKKLLEATTFVKSDSLAVYFLQMRFGYIGMTMFDNDPIKAFAEIKDIHSKTAVELMERLLINLFNPILNKRHKSLDILKDSLVIKKLIGHAIKFVHLDIGMSDEMFQFFGGNCKKEHDWYYYNLNTTKLEIGYPPILN